MPTSLQEPVSRPEVEGVYPSQPRAAMIPRSPVSVVLPVHCHEPGLVGALESLHAQGLPPWEVLVVDGGADQATLAAAVAGGARVVPSLPGRGRQLHVGALAARGEILLFLHADTRLPPSALGSIEEALADKKVVGGRFRLRFPHRRALLRMIEFSSRYPWPWTSFGDSGLFLRRETYLELGGFETIPLFEDVRFFRRLRASGTVRVLPLSVTTSCRRFCRRGPVRQLAENGFLMIAHGLGVSPETLSHWYHRHDHKTR